MNIRDIQSEIENIFDNFNRDLFNNELPQPIITIQSSGNKVTLGWCTGKRVWVTKDGSEERYEINVTAEHLSRPIEEIGETLLHEACHLYCLANGIKDTSGYKMLYHNKKYREVALTHGLNCKDAPLIGWAVTSLNDKGLAAFQRINIDLQAFDFSRVAPSEKERKPRDTKPKFVYTCACENKVVSRVEVNIHCNVCDEDFELEEKN